MVEKLKAVRALEPQKCTKTDKGRKIGRFQVVICLAFISFKFLQFYCCRMVQVGTSGLYQPSKLNFVGVQASHRWMRQVGGSVFNVVLHLKCYCMHIGPTCTTLVDQIEGCNGICLVHQKLSLYSQEK